MTLFNSSTIDALAAEMENKPVGQPVDVIKKLPRDGKLPLSFAQQRLWYIEKLEPGTPLYNLPAAYRLTGSHDRTALRRSLAAIVKRHNVLRTTFGEEGGQPFQLLLF